MNKFLTLIIVLISINTFGQVKYEIKGISEKYKGTLIIEKVYENEIFKKGKIQIFDAKTNKQIIEINSEELTFDLDKNGDVKTNVLELPYGEQSILIYQDFNFDGKNDLAIMDGQQSCYHGPSFQVYLENGDSLEYSPEFTKLAQEYCGMFQIDTETETISTMTKSGCCWHQFSKFKVIDNIPKPILIVEEDATDFPFYTTTIQEWDGEKTNERIEKTIDLQQEGITEIFSFRLANNQKQVVIYNINDRTLNYVLIRPDETVEFSYPIDIFHENIDFLINPSEDKLTFKNGGASYQVYEINNQNNIDKVGVIVEVNGKKYDLQGDLKSIKGALKNVSKLKLNNVKNQ